MTISAAAPDHTESDHTESDHTEPDHTRPDHTRPDHEIVIVGAGFSGIGTAIQLDRSGLGDYLIVEASNGPGGTWYWNTYPGLTSSPRMNPGDSKDRKSVV